MIHVRGGSFCSPPGATGETVTGLTVQCLPAAGGRNRWMRSDGTSATVQTDASIRRGLLTKLRKLGLKVKRGTPNDQLQQMIDEETTRIAQAPEQAEAEAAPEPVVEPVVAPDPAPVPQPVLEPDLPAPAPAPAPEPPAPTELVRTDEEIRPPNGAWDKDQGLVHYNSALGTLWNDLGDDKHVQVDGHALGNVVTDLGQGITLGHHSSDEALQKLKAVRAKLPTGSRPAKMVDEAISRLDAPDRPKPALPEQAPRQLHELMDRLHSLPLVRRGYDRGFHEDAPFHETEQLAEAVNSWMRGDVGRRGLQSALMGLGRSRHESSEGWSEMRAALSTALADFRDWAKRPGE